MQGAENLSKEQAHYLLHEAEGHNPGPWVGHSQHVALAAQAIAFHAGMDSLLAYTLGLLHDIGRRNGVYKIRHSIDGYRYLESLGLHHHARISITHCYTLKNMAQYNHMDDFSRSERSFVAKYIREQEYDDYDRLIQLCDFLGLPDRICRVEERIADILSRNPDAGPAHMENMKYKYRLQRHFELRMGMSLQTLFAPEDNAAQPASQ
ncbi:HD domain-containing protein [Salinispira pacifica]|uniref:HD domain protein n=1 Tax=Salinispira pacifica TaxID=1307761 RepID=V5WG97_9SPIO|nr:HD domain-containing protein [Salinispira pacifica]AHC14862.1 HD domain protein [Salinispira pacifica]